MTKPNYLYHYTSIEGLAHILSSKKIRFSRLDELDDTTEGQSKDQFDFRKFYYVSCWTSEEEESIPLWGLYTNNMSGVRIKLPLNMFKLHEIDVNEVPSFIQIADTSKAPIGAKVRILSYLPYEEIHGEDYIVTGFIENYWPYPIEYTDVEGKLNQQLVEYDAEKKMTSMKIFEVAKYKQTVWAFQKEWRFRINCHRAAPRSLKDSMSENDYFHLMCRYLGDYSKGISKRFFYLDLDDTAFSNIQVMLGPKVDEAHRIIVQSLLNSYCPSGKLVYSRLKGKLR